MHSEGCAHWLWVSLLRKTSENISHVAHPLEVSAAVVWSHPNPELQLPLVPIYAPSTVPRCNATGAVVLAITRDLEWRAAHAPALYLRKQNNCAVDLDGRSSDSELRDLRKRGENIRRQRGDPSRSCPPAFDEHGDFLPPLVGRIHSKNAKQSKLLLEQGLTGKARRHAWCNLIGRRRDCRSGEHRFYTPYLCGLRYCPICGPKAFAALFVRHLRLRTIVEKLLQHKPGNHRPRVLAKLDITIRNVGTMPTPEEIRKFNQDIRKLFRAIEKRFGISRKDYGFLWPDEFGSGNTNLHAHGVYAGPFLPQRELSKLWEKIRGDGSKIISIKIARSFEAALNHALKYPSKFFDADPSRLVDLEVAFDGVRRVHALAAFYNPNVEREPGEEGPCDPGHCPICGDLLLPAPGWHFIADLEKEGRRSTDVARVETGRERVFGRAPP